MRDNIKIPWKEQMLWVLCFSVVFSFCHYGFARPTDKDYVRAIVGEASNQTEDTMICVAHALRNRGNLRGVYGFHAIHADFESEHTWRKAYIAWALSAHEPDNVKGSKNFGTYEDLVKEGESPEEHINCGDFYFY